tara:strand:- start:4824 stop:4988 length:165 start_codon:yes stop_codon:yes gene_type:complete
MRSIHNLLVKNSFFFIGVVQNEIVILAGKIVIPSFLIEEQLKKVLFRINSFING